MKLFLKIVALDFLSALIIVLCARAYVLGSYKWTTIWEIAWVTQWFQSNKIQIEDPRARSWQLGYPAYLVGSVLGSLAGLWLSIHTIGNNLG